MGVFFLGKRYGKGVKQNGLETPDPSALVSPFEATGGYYTSVPAVDSPPPVKVEVDGAGIPRHKLPTYELPS